MLLYPRLSRIFCFLFLLLNVSLDILYHGFYLCQCSHNFCFFLKVRLSHASPSKHVLSMHCFSICLNGCVGIHILQYVWSQTSYTTNQIMNSHKLKLLKLAGIYINWQVVLLQTKELFKVDFILKIPISIVMLIKISLKFIRESKDFHIDLDTRKT